MDKNILLLVIIHCLGLALEICSSRIRLSGGHGNHEGFVEMFHDGEWRPICDDNWDMRDGKVICRQLGFARVLNITIKAQFVSNSTGKYWLDDLVCFGHETDIEYCWNRGWNEHNCRAKEEAGVICSNKTDAGILKPQPHAASGQVTSLQVRLKGGNTRGFISRGVLEVRYKGKWAPVCSDGWDKDDAYVACGQLGYPDIKDKDDDFSNIKYDALPASYWLTNLKCTGLESTLIQCDHAGWGPHKCANKKPVYLSCKVSPFVFNDQFHLGKIESHEVRLRGGYRYSEGRVEVHRNNRWGSVCDDGWDLTDANVICRQVGFGTAIEALHWAEFGSGTGRIWMDEVNCTGVETDLRDCKNGGWHKSDCGHREDAGVRCHHPQRAKPEIRIVGGKHSRIGRVEVKVKRRWFGICGIGFDSRAAEVVCRELGLGYALRGFTSPDFGYAKKIALNNMKCTGDEMSLKDCKHDGWFEGHCRYYDMASVECKATAPDLVMDAEYLQKSIKFQSLSLELLICAHEENCLAPSAAAFIHYAPLYYRSLLRFSSRFWNRGTENFLPNTNRNTWEWHDCHNHYHSMERFADYDIKDMNGKKVAHGHKASFCLEDTECDRGNERFFNCTGGGNQGISVNCADNYKNNIDCQWIDITDLKPGNYSMRVVVNPKRVIPETDYSNNAVFCNIHFDGAKAVGHNCTIDYCERRSYGGTANGECCVFPFIYKTKIYHSCTMAAIGKYWCSTTANYDVDKQWGNC